MVDSKQIYSVNQLLVVFTLTSFYHLHINLVRFTPWAEAALCRYSSKQVFFNFIQNRCKHFPVNFAKFLRTSFLQNTSGGCFSLAYRCFKICSYWTLFHNEIEELKHIFLKNEYLENFIDSSFKEFVDNRYVVKQKVPTVERKISFWWYSSI